MRDAYHEELDAISASMVEMTNLVGSAMSRATIDVKTVPGLETAEFSTLIEADVVRGKRMTSWPSLQTDLRNAGAEWVDEQLVTDQNLITSRNPDDLPAFIGALLEAVNHGVSSAASVDA